MPLFWKKFKVERRNAFRKQSFAALVLFIVLWFAAVGMAMSPTMQSNGEKQDKTGTYMLIGMIQGLVAFIYISGMTSVKNSIRKLWKHVENLHSEKLSEEDHQRICDLRKENMLLEMENRELKRKLGGD